MSFCITGTSPVVVSFIFAVRTHFMSTVTNVTARLLHLDPGPQARGAFGDVYRASHPALGCVALKRPWKLDEVRRPLFVSPTDAPPLLAGSYSAGVLPASKYQAQEHPSLLWLLSRCRENLHGHPICRVRLCAVVPQKVPRRRQSQTGTSRNPLQVSWRISSWDCPASRNCVCTALPTHAEKPNRPWRPAPGQSRTLSGKHQSSSHVNLSGQCPGVCGPRCAFWCTSSCATRRLRPCSLRERTARSIQRRFWTSGVSSTGARSRGRCAYIGNRCLCARDARRRAVVWEATVCSRRQRCRGAPQTERR